MALFRRSRSVSALANTVPPRSANDLRLHETGTICCLQDPEMALKLLEMGCVPGQTVRLSGRAPLGDPLMLVLGNEEYTLSLRVSEAVNILLK